MSTEKPVTAEVVPERTPTLKEIVADSKLGGSFNGWVERNEKPDLAAKLLAGKLEAGDLEELAALRDSFIERKKEVTQITENWGREENLKVFVDRYPELKKISGLVGVDGLKEAVSKVVEKISLSPEGVEGDKEGESQHKQLFGLFTKWAEASQTLAIAKGEAAKLLQGSELTHDEALAVSVLGDKTEREEKIKELLSAKNKGPAQEKGFWLWKRKDWSPEQKAMIEADAAKFSDEVPDGETKSGAEKLQAISSLTSEYSYREKEVAFKVAFLCSEEGTAEIGALIMGGETESKRMSFGDIKKELKKMQDKDAIKKDFYADAGEHFETFIGDASHAFDLSDEAQRVPAKEAFLKDFFERRADSAGAKRGGVFAWAYELLLEEFVKEFSAELAGETNVDPVKKKLIPKVVKAKK